MSAQGVRNLQGQRRRRRKEEANEASDASCKRSCPSTFTRVYFISVACASGVTPSYPSSSSGSYAFVLPFLYRHGRKLARRVHTHIHAKNHMFYTCDPNNNFRCAKEKSLIDFTLIFSASLYLPHPTPLSFLYLSLYVQSFYFDFMTPNVFESSKKKRRKNSHNFHYYT